MNGISKKNWWQWLITHRIEQVNIIFGVNWFKIKEHCYNFSFRIFERFFMLRTYLIFHVSNSKRAWNFMIEIAILKIAFNSSHSLWIDSYECIHQKINNKFSTMCFYFDWNWQSNPSEKAKSIKWDWKPVKWIEFFL